MAFDWLNNTAGSVVNTAGGAFNSAKDLIGKGVARAADAAADVAADTALAPLNLIETSLNKVAKLGPDIVAKRRDAINAMLSGIEEAAIKYDAEAAAKKMADAKAIVEARVKKIFSDSSIPDKIKDEYNLILRNKDATPEDLLDALANADDSLLVYEKKEFNGWRLIKRAWRFASDYIYYILILISAIFGGIIMSNVYINETFLPIRLYYFFYGTVFFPLSLLYGIVNPPEWNAMIFPWFRIVGNQRFIPPKVGGAPPTLSAKEAAEMAGAVARGKAMYGATPTMASDALSQVTSTGKTPAEAAKDAVNILEVAGVPEAVAQKQVAAALQSKGVPAAEALRVASIPNPLTLMQRITIISNMLFGYKMGGSTIVIRLISGILAFTTVVWAYYREDLDDFIRVFRKSMGFSTVTVPKRV